jgi:hypothetical protein
LSPILPLAYARTVMGAKASLRQLLNWELRSDRQG